MARKRHNVKRRNRRHVNKKSSLKKSKSLRVRVIKLTNTLIHNISRYVKQLKHAHVSPKLRKRLQRQSKNLNKFISRKTTVATKRRMLAQQRGGFAPLLWEVVRLIPGKPKQLQRSVDYIVKRNRGFIRS